MEVLRTLRDGAKLVLVIVPRLPARAIGPASYWAMLALFAGALHLESWLVTPEPRAWIAYSLHGFAYVGVLALLLGLLAGRGFGRPALLWPVAALVLASQFWIEVLMWPVELLALPRSPLSEQARSGVARNLWLVLTLVSLRRLFDYVEPARPVFQRGAAALVLGAALLLPLMMLPPLPGYQSYGEPFDPEGFAEAAEETPAFDPELVLETQPGLLDAALAALAPQRPGQVDLYVVSFGGDGSERVFRNEVEYVERLFATRFGAAGRIVTLVNSPETTATRPLATRTNLHRALRGVGARIDPDEDIVLLFLTTHGSEDHELYVALDPLPLWQLEPEDLGEALEQAGVGWRIVIVSACYSGGFIPALEGPRALVMSAAREDRTSFGCGAESELTYFGRALFAEALNETASPLDAFARAKARIAEWEAREGQTRSEPQISSNPEIEAQLARWLAQLEPGPKVPFEPARDEPDAAGDEIGPAVQAEAEKP